MLKFNCFIIVFLSLISCKSPDINKINDISADYEVINAFLQNLSPYSYINNEIGGRAYNTRFEGAYNLQLEAYKTYDSICKNDKDPEQRKFYCPLADSYNVFRDLITKKDFGYLKEQYSNPQKPIQLDWSKVNGNFLAHTTPSQDAIPNEKIRNTSEFPSIEIYNIFYTEDRNTAIVAFGVRESSMGGGLQYFILKKMDDIWWKPITAITLSYV